MFYLSRSEQGALVLLLALLLGGAGLLMHARGKRAAVARAEHPIFVPAPQLSGQPGETVVHVSGAVVRPGVYRLRSGSRVSDVIQRAGGPQPEADLAGLNLAARLRDGQHVTVPLQRGSPAARASPTRLPAERISLNQATHEQLELLPGIGPVYAQYIIDYRDRKTREQGRGFESVDELLNVPGIGPKRLAAIRDRVLP